MAKKKDEDEKPKGLRDEIDAAVVAAEGEDDDVQDDDKKTAADADNKSEGSESDDAETGDGDRDSPAASGAESGDGDGTGDGAGGDDAGTSAGDADDDAAGDAESDDTEPPAAWSAEDQKMFLEQPKEAQEFLRRRHGDMERDYQKKMEETAPVRRVIEHWNPYFQQLGAAPDVAINKLINAEYHLRTGTPEQKKQMLGQLAKDYGISLEAQAAANPSADVDLLDDGTNDAIERAMAPIKQTLGQLQTAVQTREAAIQQAGVSDAERQVQEFRDQKTEAGRPAHPHFDEVQELMVQLAQAERAAGKQPELKDLYERAIWSHPDVRPKLLLAQETAKKKQEERDKKERLKKAEKAGSSVTGSPSGTKDQPESLRETIVNAFN